MIQLRCCTVLRLKWEFGEIRDTGRNRKAARRFSPCIEFIFFHLCVALKSHCEHNDDEVKWMEM